MRYKQPRSVVAFLFVLISFSAFAQDSARSTGWVVIPITEYRSLYTKAHPLDREPESPPVEATLSRLDYDLQVNGDLASGRATLTVDVLKEGWVRVPVPSGLLVRQARLDGKPLALSRDGAILSKRGRSVLFLDFVLPIAASSGVERLTLPGTASGVCRASLTLARADSDLTVTGGFLAPTTGAAAPNKWVAYGGAAPLVFSWRRKTEDHRVEQPLRLRGNLTELVGLAEDSTSVYAEITVDVVQGTSRQVRIQVPAAVTVNQVLGPMVADWERKGDELTVTFLEPVEQKAQFAIAAETRLPREGDLAIPLLHLDAAERETGGVAVEVLGAGEIKLAKPRGLEHVEGAELGPMVASRQSPSLAAFRWLPASAPGTRSLNVQVARYTQQAVLTAIVEEARYRTLLSTDGKTLVEARYAVRNNQRNFARLTLPAGAIVWSASLAGRAVRPGLAPDGSLLLPLDKTRSGEDAAPFAIEILYLNKGTAWTDKGRAALTLPALDLPISKTGITLYYPPLFKVTAEPGAFRGDTYSPPASPALTAAASSPPEDERAAGTGQLAQQRFANAAQNTAMQSLVDRYRAESGARRGPGFGAVSIGFPAVGPSLYFVSELTAEGRAPALSLNYQQEKKGGSR